VEFFTPLLGAGVLWHSQHQFCGISSPDLFEPNLRPNRFETINYRNYFFQYGAIVNAGRQIKWVPSVLLKYNKGTQLLLDVNSMVLLKEALWLACSYRHSVSWNFLVQAQITNQLSIGYSYEYPIGEYSRWGGVSHEFKVGYRFELFKSNYYMPRFF
jgi:type IX secretion system PorP/SprF family membrane protein